MYEREIQKERLRTEQIAQQLSIEASHQWQRAVTGVLALPAATALGLAATALQMAAFFERGFEIFTESAESVRRNIDGTRKSEATHRPEWNVGAGEPEPHETPRS